ncbi:MAG: hypothetical protein EKK55_17030 [Rhodocyclaceae bacterium]|nr:MAG: hypothetical protein EKK55_17030 [Rhodocyclaceae bacterium]
MPVLSSTSAVALRFCPKDKLLLVVPAPRSVRLKVTVGSVTTPPPEPPPSGVGPPGTPPPPPPPPPHPTSTTVAPASSRPLSNTSFFNLNTI